MAGVKGRSGGGFDKPFRDAIMQAIHRTHKDGKTKRLHIIAEKLVLDACEGIQWAVVEVMNRCDGKPTPILEGIPDGAEATVTVTFRTIDDQGHLDEAVALPKANGGDILH